MYLRNRCQERFNRLLNYQTYFSLHIKSSVSNQFYYALICSVWPQSEVLQRENQRETPSNWVWHLYINNSYCLEEILSCDLFSSQSSFLVKWISDTHLKINTFSLHVISGLQVSTRFFFSMSKCWIHSNSTHLEYQTDWICIEQEESLHDRCVRSVWISSWEVHQYQDGIDWNIANRLEVQLSWVS